MPRTEEVEKKITVKKSVFINKNITISSERIFAIPENARTTKVKVAGNLKGWSAPIDNRSSPATTQQLKISAH